MSLEGYVEFDPRPPKSRAEYQRTWRKENPGKAMTYLQRYWERRLGAVETHTAEEEPEPEDKANVT